MEHKKEIRFCLLLFISLLILTASVKAQEEESGSEINNGAGQGQEDISGITDAASDIIALTDESDASYLFEKLADLREKPVIINSGDEEEIARLFFLTEFQVMVLADYVTKKGDVVSVYELALLPAFDRNTVMLLAPFISLESSEKSYLSRPAHTTVLLTAAGSFSHDDEGGVRSLLKISHEGERLSYGLTAENDPGEPYGFRDAAGTDFLSGYMAYHGHGLIDRIIFGDYSLRFGEGLIFNSGSWQGSWLSSPSFMTGRSGVAQYSSSEENNFFRGAAVALGDMTRGAVLFGSCNMIDARLLVDEDGNAVGVTGLVKGGIHNSVSSSAARNSLTEVVAGTHVTLGGEKVRAGLTSAVTWFSLPVLPDIGKPENVKAFTGDRLVNVSADLKATTGPLLFFTEAAVSFPGSWAVTGGIRAKPLGRVTFNILARYLSPAYYAFHSGTFREGSGSGNEAGIAGSIHLELARHLFVSAGADHYRFPWPVYRSSSPCNGNRIEFKGEYLPRDDISLRLLYTASSREYDLTAESGIAPSITRGRRVTAITFSCSPAQSLTLTTRASASFVSPGGEKGFLLCQDLSYAFHAVPLKIWFRYALCSSSSYEGRLYAWENDLLYSFSVPALYGESSRSFIMLSWKPFDRMEIRVKYAVTVLKEEFAKEIRQEARGQVRIVF